MKILTTMMMAMCITLSLSACEPSTLENNPGTPETPQTPDEDEGEDGDDSSTRTAITLTVGETVLEAYLNDNRTARDLISRLPVTVTLNRGLTTIAVVYRPRWNTTKKMYNTAGMTVI